MFPITKPLISETKKNKRDVLFWKVLESSLGDACGFPVVRFITAQQLSNCYEFTQPDKPSFSFALERSNMPSYKLYYFNARGRAEPARLVFAAAGIEFEDNRMAMGEWPKVKKELHAPFGQVPLLVIDDKIKLAQSLAIMTFIAREGGLAPSNSLDIAKCDMIVGAEEDFLTKKIQCHFEKDEAKKKELDEAIQNTHLPAFMGALTKILEENGTGFLVTDKMTYADIIVFNACNNLDSGALDKFPKLKQHHDRIANNPGIKAYLEKRPKTDF